PNPRGGSGGKAQRHKRVERVVTAVRQPALVRVRMLAHRKPGEAGVFHQPRDLAETGALAPAAPVLDRPHREHQVVTQRFSLLSSERATTTRCTSVAPSPR